MCRELLLSTLLIGAICPSATAQAGLRAGIGQCSGRAGDLSRLSCYDSLARQLGFRQTHTSTPAGGERWHVSTERNPIDDTPTISLSLVATTGRSTFGRPVVLVVRCLSRELSVFIDWQSFLGEDETQVLARLGSDSASTETWGNSTDNTATFYQGDAVDLLRRLLATNRFVAQVTPYDESPITAVFNVSGLRAAASGIPVACPDVTLN